MRSAVPVAACAIFLAFGLSAGDTSAATTKKAKAPTSKSQSSKASRSSKGKSRAASAKAAPIAAPLPELSQAQLDVSQLVHIGRAECEFDQSVLIEPDVTRFGAFRVKYNNKTYKMVPEKTATGAIRLQDINQGVVWLQIPVKSMLMNMNLGQRMVDACTQPAQRTAQTDAIARARDAAARLANPAAIDSMTPGSPVAQPVEPLPLLRN